MSFVKLTLKVAGLCLFVPEPTAQPRLLHMILPRAGHDSHGAHCSHSHPIERHYARLYYHTTYGPNNDPDCSSPNRPFHCISLEGKALDLTHLPSSDGIGALPGDVVDLDKVVQEKVHPALIGLDPAQYKDVVAARITVAAGAGRSLHPQGRWQFGKQGLDKMAWRIEWTIRVNGLAQLEWELAGLNGSEGRPLRPLRPGSGGAIELQVVNAIAREAVPNPRIPPPPPRGTKADHFCAYYDLFAKPADTPIPVYDGKEGIGPRGLPYSCMVARASL